MVEQVFLPVGKAWSIHNADTQCKEGDRGGQRAKENFYV